MRVRHKNPWLDFQAIFPRSSSAILSCKYLLLASKVENVVASRSHSIHSFMRGVEYDSRNVSAFNVLVVEAKKRALSLLSRETLGKAHFNWGVYMASMGNVRFIFFFSNPFISSPAWCGVKWIDWLPVLLSFIRCHTALSEPIWPSHLHLSFVSMVMKFLLVPEYSTDRMSSPSQWASDISSNCFTMLCWFFCSFWKMNVLYRATLTVGLE